MSRIFVIDDDPDVLDLTVDVLKRAGHSVRGFEKPRSFLRVLEEEIPDLVVLDMNLPGISGQDLLRTLRRDPRTRQLPMLAFSGEMVETKDVVSGLDLGADEYLLKPVKNDLLLVRVSGLIDRNRHRPAKKTESREKVLQLDGLCVGLSSREVLVNEKSVQLTRLEFDLLVYLLEHRRHVVARSTLLERVWGSENDGSPRAVDKRIEMLRARLGKFGQRIRTVFGIGYSLDG